MFTPASINKMQPLLKGSLSGFRHVLNQAKPVMYGGAPIVRSFRSSPSNGASLRSRLGRSKRGDDVSSPAVALDTGRIALAAGAALGMGGLCYYGLSLTPNSHDLSALDRSFMWPDYVRDRIRATYGYFAGSSAIAAGTAAMLARSTRFCSLMAGSGIMAPLGMLALTVGTSIVCQSIPYPPSGELSAKHLAWALFSASIGAALVPVCFVGGPILTRAAIYTGGIVGGLSMVAASAPSTKFLNWGGPLAIGLGVVFVSSLGSMFLSPVGRLGAGLYAVSLYGGLFLFSGFLLYDTQLVIKRAEMQPPVNRMFTQPGVMVPHGFDPINNSIHIFMDTVNIFIRMVTILSGSGQRRK